MLADLEVWDTVIPGLAAPENGPGRCCSGEGECIAELVYGKLAVI